MASERLSGNEKPKRSDTRGGFIPRRRTIAFHLPLSFRIVAIANSAYYEAIA
ncbi:hypothetical protein GCM10011335_53470 [Aureimonas glaciei]|uniref:Uncharacterized protein n=1 Tax=Aureimonas glaciei TaxID=1776957 RepID=A0A916YGY9_9HYPH|nr:hypothetical protein GCM10011335_53470 [Aureimonas glaciei]